MGLQLLFLSEKSLEFSLVTAEVQTCPGTHLVRYLVSYSASQVLVRYSPDQELTWPGTPLTRYSPDQVLTWPGTHLARYSPDQELTWPGTPLTSRCVPFFHSISIFYSEECQGQAGQIEPLVPGSDLTSDPPPYLFTVTRFHFVIDSKPHDTNSLYLAKWKCYGGNA
ncbi:unnamed protein product [Boreogadus saida]